MPRPEGASAAEANQPEIDYLAKMLQARFPLPPEDDLSTPASYIHPVSNNFTPEQIASKEHAPTIGKLNDAGIDHLVTATGDEVKLRAVRGVVLPERGSLTDRKLLRYIIFYPGNLAVAGGIGSGGTAKPSRPDRGFLVDVYDDGRPSEAWTGLSNSDHRRATSAEVSDVYMDIERSRAASPEAAAA
ncbi:MAG TPA: hypothetical protein VFC50_02970 [Candidatus Dormibacteraeota bacterium]|nr:hypothetical protein [Candidatus Dormibacteraeota bacterium]